MMIIENDLYVRSVQRLLGRSHIVTTEIYTHVTDHALQSALTLAEGCAKRSLTVNIGRM